MELLLVCELQKTIYKEFDAEDRVSLKRNINGILARDFLLVHVDHWGHQLVFVLLLRLKRLY